MKKFLNFLGGFLIIACLALTGTYLMSSCENSGSFFGDKDEVTQEYVDSTVAVAAQNLINPLFSNVDDVLAFREKSLEGQAIDDVFNTMPEEILTNVASVCIKREGHVSKRTIVYEYRANRSIYDNLPQASNDNTSTQEAAKTPADTVKRRPDGTITYQQHDTTIDGRKYKAHIKTETSYE